MPDEDRLRAQGRREAIAERYSALLSHADSPLLSSDAVVDQLMGQLDSVLDAAFADAGLPGYGKAKEPQNSLALSAEIGAARAVAGIHPAQSLHAASLIFEAAVPIVADALRDAGRPDPELTAAGALNRTIMERMSVAAESYVGFLLGRIHESNRYERLKISRDLHDVVAPSIVLALQGLQLHDAFLTRAPEQAASKLQLARRSLDEAIDTVRSLAAESRESLSRNGVHYAVSHVLARVAAETTASLEVTGPIDMLPPLYAEEVFLVVQEAIRNAVTHGAPNLVTVNISTTEHEVIAEITDDGRGFDPGSVKPAGDRGIGLASMQERAALLGGTIKIDSAVGAGTTVILQVPLPPAVQAEIAAQSSTPPKERCAHD